jgi:hypothetical protein|nr:MAG: hypothetical protein KatS3mg041_0527 [Bacteroidota bacterium]
MRTLLSLCVLLATFSVARAQTLDSGQLLGAWKLQMQQPPGDRPMGGRMMGQMGERQLVIEQTEAGLQAYWSTPQGKVPFQKVELSNNKLILEQERTVQTPDGQERTIRTRMELELKGEQLVGTMTMGMGGRSMPVTFVRVAS